MCTKHVHYLSPTMPHFHLHVVVDGVGVVVDGIGGATVGPLPTVENTIKYTWLS